MNHDQRQQRRNQGDHRGPDKGHEALLPALLHLNLRLVSDDLVPRFFEILKDCRLNSSDLQAQNLDERTRCIFGCRSKFQRRHFRLIVGDGAIEAFEVVVPVNSARRFQRGFSAKVCSRTSASTEYCGSPASNLR
jgi:hypothetical protein